MTYWLSLLILAASPDAPVEHPGAEVVYRTSFDQDSDINFDGWPDEWTRRRGEGFPLYVNIAIAEEPAVPQSNCLRIVLDGGAATVYSPPITIDPHFSYVLQGRLRTSQLRRDRVFFSLNFSPEPHEDEPDAENDVKETSVSSKFTDVPTWQYVEIGPIKPESLTARGQPSDSTSFRSDGLTCAARSCLTTSGCCDCHSWRSPARANRTSSSTRRMSRSPARPPASDVPSPKCIGNCSMRQVSVWPARR